MTVILNCIEPSGNQPLNQVNGEQSIYFLTVNYHSTTLVRQLLASLPFKEYPSLKLVIVNNSPEDIAINNLSQNVPEIRVIPARKNLGFGSGCNLGIKQIYHQDSQALVWLINPDAVLENHAIEYIRGCLYSNPNIAILGTRIQDSLGNLWFSEGQFNPWIGSLKHQFPVTETSNTGVNILPSRWVSGCSLILNLAQFATCPQFDPNYFLYYEDNELCERYYRQGYQIAVTEAILVTHQVSAISDQNKPLKILHATYSKLYFLSQYGTWLAVGLNLAYFAIKIIQLWRQDRQIAIAHYQGIQKFLQKRLKIPHD